VPHGRVGTPISSQRHDAFVDTYAGALVLRGLLPWIRKRSIEIDADSFDTDSLLVDPDDPYDVDLVDLRVTSRVLWYDSALGQAPCSLTGFWLASCVMVLSFGSICMRITDRRVGWNGEQAAAMLAGACANCRGSFG